MSYPEHLVYVPEEDWIPWNEDTMEFLNIEEDEMGRDLITFLYKGKEYKSLVRTK